MILTEPDWRGHPSNPDGKIHIGKNTEILEYAIINKPTENCTYIGNDCYVMNQTFIGHDSRLGDGVQLNPGCTVAGFVNIGDFTHIGMNASVHQKSTIGNYCVIGAGSFFKGNSPDGIVWGGVPAIPIKVNMIGIERSKLSEDEKKLMIEEAEEFIHHFKSSRDI
jgi:UDP-N-acetylglucosamine acyltransferase